MKQFSDIYKHRICCCQWRFVVQSIVNTDNHLCRYLLCRYFTVVLHIWCIYSQIQINNQKTVLRQKVTVLCGEQEGGEENPSEMYDRKHTLSSHTTLPSTLEENTRITVGKMYILIWVLFLLGRRDVWCFTHKPEMFFLFLNMESVLESTLKYTVYHKIYLSFKHQGLTLSGIKCKN